MPEEYKPSEPRHRAIDIDSDEGYIYIACLDENDNIRVLKISAALDEDAEVSYEAIGGVEIGVQCGRYEAELVYAFGELDGTKKIINQSYIDGAYWFQQDPGTWTGSTRVVLDVEDDYWVIAYSTGDKALRENFGNYFYFEWEAIAGSGTISFDIFSMRKSDIFPDDLFFGVDVDGSYWYTGQDIVRFSPNSGGSIVSQSFNLLGVNPGSVTGIEVY